MIAIWAETPQEVDAAELETRIAALKFRSCDPFSAERVGLLAEISRRILTDPRTRHSAQYVALAYWLRRASIERLVQAICAREQSGQVRTARGVALHLPPTNVDTIFVYSWAISLLAGNANVVRLPDTLKPETGYLVELITSALTARGEDGQLFCHYPYGTTVDAALAPHIDLRVIWGGDAKVAAVSRVPIRPDGITIGFPDRRSLAVVSTPAYRRADDNQRTDLSERFFNDLYWFDQMGCGSPRLVTWIGDPGDLAVDFYRRIAKTAASKGYPVETGTAIGKLSASYDLLAEGITSGHATFGNLLHVSRAADPVAALARPHGGGFICDWVVDDLAGIAALADRPLQTITYFGLAPDECEGLARSLRGRGGYRVVPIGLALQFDPTWDGMDLTLHMTRVISWQ